MSTTSMTRPTPVRTAGAQGVSFSLALDRSSYDWTAGQRTLSATLTLQCQPGTPLTLSFAGGQEFDVAIHDSQGRQVALWSAGQAFFDHVQTVSVDAERRWQATMAVPEPAPVPRPMPGGPALAGGAFTATGYLTPAGGPVTIDGPWGGMHPGAIAAPTLPVPSVRSPAYSATVAFTVHAEPVLLGTPPGAA